MKKYIYSLIVLIIVFIIGNSINEQINKKAASSARIQCHKKIKTFEKVFDSNLLKLIKEDVKKNKVWITIKEKRAKYMKSQLFDYLDSKKVKDDFINILKVKATQNAKSTIDILIYENDKNDPGKKNPKSKLFAGYLIFDFKYENKLAYKIQIDFMDHQGKDIPKVLQCVKSSFETLK